MGKKMPFPPPKGGGKKSSGGGKGGGGMMPFQPKGGKKSGY